MRDERRAPGHNNANRPDNSSQPGRTGEGNRNAANQQQRQGPLSSVAGWLGNAFDRSRIDKREAEERRRRMM